MNMKFFELVTFAFFILLK